MPKRLDTASSYRMSFTSDAVIENPELATWLAVVMNAWSNLELELGRSLATFLNTQPKVGLAIYEALYTGSMRVNVLKKVAKASGAGELEAKVFCKLVDLLKERGEERNTLAHGIWGFSYQLPTALLRVPQETVLEQEMAHLIAPGQPLPDTYHDTIEVYEKEDLVEIYTRIMRLELLFIWFWHWNEKDDPERDKWRHMLCSEPRLAEVLSPPKKGRGSKPSTRPQ